MKSGLSIILGRRIVGAFLGYRVGGPKSQLYLAFDDHTAYEFYSSDGIRNTSGMDPWTLENVASYMRQPYCKFVYSAVFDRAQPRAIEHQIGIEHDAYRDSIEYVPVPPERYRR